VDGDFREVVGAHIRVLIDTGVCVFVGTDVGVVFCCRVSLVRVGGGAAPFSLKRYLTTLNESERVFEL